MRQVFEFFNSYSLDIVGYTLLHSLWQGLIVSGIVAVLLRNVPTKHSNTRYAVATVGLFSIVIMSVITFVYLRSGLSGAKTLSLTREFPGDFAQALSPSPAAVTTYLTSVQTLIEWCMPFFLMIWIAGAFVFVMRIVMGLVHIERLRGQAMPMGTEWHNYIQEISAKLKIDRVVTLAESAVEAPVVIGYLKPFILIPIGMCASLSTAQLETIFIHELMHIRRKDYLINMMQCFVEAIYFFNPFVWTLSNMIKSEREHCCDDAVVQIHGNATVYASALAALEEVRLSKTTLSLSLAGNKNELLKRIKRLMEKSAQHYYGGRKIVPALLLVLGLISASWISSTTTPAAGDENLTHIATVVQDTTKKGKKNKAAKKAQREKTASSNEVQNEVEVDEQVEVENEIDLEEKVETDQEDFSVVPPFPDFDFHVPPMPEIAGMMPPIGELDALVDGLAPPLADWKGRDWEKFSKEFEERFKSKFGDFYEKNEKDIQILMDEIQQSLNERLGPDFEANMQDFAKKQEQWAKAHADRWEQQAKKMSLHNDRLQKMGEEMHRMGEHFHEEFEKNHKDFERRHKAFEEKSRNFQNVLREELTKDGYLEKGEKLESIQFYNETLKINGEPIRSEHQKKYNELREKYFGNPGNIIKVE